MILTLEVVGEQGADLGAAGRKVFRSIGGTIGRLPDNDWVLPDPYISGRHALIRYLNGKFFVEDTSTNGVFINSHDNRLPRSEPYPLSNGDMLFIDEYEISVSIANDLGAAGRKPGDPLELPKPAGAKAPAQVLGQAAAAQEDRTESMDKPRTEWVGPSEEPLPAPSAAPGPKPAVARAAPAPKPEKAKPSAPRPLPPAAPPARQSRAESAELQTLLDAAGIQGLEASPELARTLGEVLHVAVGGLMEILRERERMKDELRMRGTIFKAANNNPLKFSANVEDAFHNLLVKHNPAYLAPPDAFVDALHDVRDHQAAILAAMRLAFEAMLAQFDPDNLQEEFDRQMKKRGSRLGVPARLRYWDLYRDRYHEAARNADMAFRNLFGTEFAKAYEEHLERMKAFKRDRET